MRIIFQQPRPDKKSERRGIPFFPPLSAEGRARPGHARARPGAPGAPRPVRPGLDHDPDCRRCRKLPGELKPNDGLGTAFCFSSAESLSLTGRPAIWFPQNSTIYNSGTHTRAQHGSGRVQGAGGGAPKVQVGEATALPPGAWVRGCSFYAHSHALPFGQRQTSNPATVAEGHNSCFLIPDSTKWQRQSHYTHL